MRALWVPSSIILPSSITRIRSAFRNRCKTVSDDQGSAPFHQVVECILYEFFTFSIKGAGGPHPTAAPGHLSGLPLRWLAVVFDRLKVFTPRFSPKMVFITFRHFFNKIMCIGSFCRGNHSVSGGCWSAVGDIFRCT